jgi:transcription initiation factor TFIIIB Brf1 subunit/transcription initiation factor TFIIB
LKHSADLSSAISIRDSLANLKHSADSSSVSLHRRKLAMLKHSLCSEVSCDARFCFYILRPLGRMRSRLHIPSGVDEEIFMYYRPVHFSEFDRAQVRVCD